MKWLTGSLLKGAKGCVQLGFGFKVVVGIPLENRGIMFNQRYDVRDSPCNSAGYQFSSTTCGEIVVQSTCEPEPAQNAGWLSACRGVPFFAHRLHIATLVAHYLLVSGSIGVRS